MGLLEDNVPPRPSHVELDTTILDAVVLFADGARSHFHQVDFLPDGRLKATISTPVKVSDKTSTTTSNVAYYAHGSWHAVHGPTQGVLVAEIYSVRTEHRHIELVGNNISQNRAAELAKTWADRRAGRNARLVPRPGTPSERDSAELEVAYDLEMPIRGWPDQYEVHERISFRWIAPGDEELPRWA
jgi:hypothetical protein